MKILAGLKNLFTKKDPLKWIKLDAANVDNLTLTSTKEVFGKAGKIADVTNACTPTFRFNNGTPMQQSTLYRSYVPAKGSKLANLGVQSVVKEVNKDSTQIMGHVQVNGQPKRLYNQELRNYISLCRI